MPASSLAELHALRNRLSSAELDQGHLFKGWPSSDAAYTPAQVALLGELQQFSLNYPGGVEQYIRNGKRLLEADRHAGGGGDEEGETSAIQAMEMPALVFDAPDLFCRSPALADLETQGAALAQKSVFVLVAGGLGERLGYSNIKVGLPVETATLQTYLMHYLSWAKAAAGPTVPFVIMTSNDTHTRTVELLETLHLGMPNLRLLKQETVFCFSDADAHLAVSEDGSLLRKPHGHGDVHSLIFTAKASENGDQPLMDSWLADGYEYIVFLQDTNAPATLTTPISLAISERENLDMNFTCIPRQPKEAIGLLCRTLRVASDPKREASGSSPVPVWCTSIVEYNVFEGLAAHLTEAGGDTAAKGSEYSPFPGSINTLVFKLASYAKKLTSSHGAVPEFINPKYADERRNTFRKPARVESLMQDFALLFTEEEGSRVGGTVFDRFTYQPVKNALVDACEKAKHGMAPYCAASGEESYYELVRRRLQAIGVGIKKAEDDSPDVVVGSVLKTHLFPIVTLDAAACTGGSARSIDSLTNLSKTFPHPEHVSISPTSTLMIEGKVVVNQLNLDGVLKLVGPPMDSKDPPLVVQDLDVKNAKWHARETTGNDINEVDRVRGFIIEKTPPELLSASTKL